jgi:hypothetical protein
MFVILFVMSLIFGGGVSGQDYEDVGLGCIVHHPPHNDEFSCASLCDPTLLGAEVVKAVFLTGFLANFDCLRNKTGIMVCIFSFFGPQKFSNLFSRIWFSVFMIQYNYLFCNFV